MAGMGEVALLPTVVIIKPKSLTWRRNSVKELIKQYLDEGMSRRQLMTGLSALGWSTVAAKSMAQSLSPAVSAPATAVREIQGTGGALFVAQLKAAGVKYVFFNPSTGDYPIFDALVDEPGIQVIKGVHEGAVVAMADGYARATGKPGVVIVANVGLPNAMTQMINSWKDQIPLLVAVASADRDTMGREQLQEADFHEVHDQPDHQMDLGGENHRRDPRNATARAEICFDTAVRAGVPGDAERHATR